MIYQILFSIFFAQWFALLREPEEIFSFYQSWANKKNRVIRKILTCGFCHSGYIALFFILTGADVIILPISMIGYKILNKLLERLIYG